MQSQVKSSSNRSFIALQENESKWQLIEKAQFIICQVLKQGNIDHRDRILGNQEFCREDASAQRLGDKLIVIFK